MFNFAWPWMGLLLIVPVAMWLRNRSRTYATTDTQERKTTLLHPDLHNLEAAFKTRHPAMTLGTRAYYLLLALLWTGLTAAIMQPQWLEPHTEERSEGYDLMLAVDTSHSMEALDFTVDGKQVSRMQVVKGVMGRFIEGRADDRIGLIIFGSRAFVLSPLTLDRQAVRHLLDDLVPRIAGDGTAMGDALGLGVKKLRERPPGSRVLVLIADGENTAGTIPPLAAAQLAAYEGIRIYAIGVGSDQKEVPIVENGRLITRDDLGFDEAVMRQIANASGGAYFRGTDTSALETIYKRIDELEKSKAESRTVMIPHPLYRWPLGVALAALLALGLFPAPVHGVWPGGAVMVETGLHFAEPLWLWGLLAIPVVIAWLLFSAPFRQHGLEVKYADAHLLPYLTGVATMRRVSSRAPLLGWALAWSLLALAMAGPRWDFRQMNPFEPGADLVILLDISRSMEVTDVNPSRLERARQEIQDLVAANPGISIGLVAFATVAHVVTPITEDGESLLRELPAISTSLVQLQGSRLSDAIDRADRLLAGQGEDVAHNILLISDGDFGETGIIEQVKELRDKGTRFHVLGIGSSQGGPVPGLLTTSGEPVISWLDEDGLQQLAETGGGAFRVADYRSGDTRAILDAIVAHAKTRQNEEMRTLVWNEYFYWLLIPAMLMLLYLYRPGAGSAHFGRRGAAS